MPCLPNDVSLVVILVFWNRTFYDNSVGIYYADMEEDRPIVHRGGPLQESKTWF